jgi:hypothetical protein
VEKGGGEGRRRVGASSSDGSGERERQPVVDGVRVQVGGREGDNMIWKQDQQVYGRVVAFSSSRMMNRGNNIHYSVSIRIGPV